MLENYELTKFGIIKQISKINFDYGFDYSSKYNNYGEKGTQLAHLRLGTLIGAIGKIPNSIMDIGYGNGDFLKT